MQTSAAWNEDVLNVRQRPNVFLWFGLVACWGLLLLASTTLLPECVRQLQRHEVGDAVWLLGIVLTLLACTIGMTLLVRHTWRDVRVSASSVWLARPGVRMEMDATRIVHLLLHREKRMVSGRYGRGQLPFVVLALCHDDGQTQELLVMEEDALSEASWRALCEGVAAQPFGRVKLG